MFKFLDDHDLTENERGDIDRILYHPKDKSKCQFPEDEPCSTQCDRQLAFEAASASRVNDFASAAEVVSYSEAGVSSASTSTNLNYSNQNPVASIALPMVGGNNAYRFIPVPVASSQNYVTQAAAAHHYMAPMSNNPQQPPPGGGMMVPPHMMQYFIYPNPNRYFYPPNPASAPYFLYAPTVGFLPPELNMNAANADALAATAHVQQVSEYDKSGVDAEKHLESNCTETTMSERQVEYEQRGESPPDEAAEEEQTSQQPPVADDVNNVETPLCTFDAESTSCDSSNLSKQPNSNDIAHDSEDILAVENDSMSSPPPPHEECRENVDAPLTAAEDDAVETGEEVVVAVVDGFVKEPSTTNSEVDVAASSPTAGETTKSWASLFKNSAAANNAIVISKFSNNGDASGGDHSSSTVECMANFGEKSATAQDKSQFNVTLTTVDRDPPAQGLGKLLKSYSLSHKGPAFQLRGLNNYGNWCYVNATLQALLACPPFVHLLRRLSSLEMRTPSSTPMSDALVKFIGEFPERYIRKTSSGHDLDKAPSFEPAYIYNVLSSLHTDTSFKGRQEDAEEFLGVVLNRLHEELASCLAFSSENHVVANGDTKHVISTIDDDWQHVGPGKRAAVTRMSKLGPSPITEIFSGVLRNSFQQHGSKETVALESFFTLQLSIQSNEVNSLQSALLHIGKEIMKNVALPTGKPTEGEMIRRTVFSELPIVLILHLKYFYFVDDTVKKLLKPIQYGMDLQIDRSLTTKPTLNVKNDKFSRSYKLFAVVFHHGEKAEGGHYTSDIFHGGHWVNMDDAKIEIVDESHVTSFQSPRVPYLLFYRRCDTFSDNRASANN